MSEINLPDHFDWIAKSFSHDQIQQLITVLDQPLDISIRLNPLKTDVDKKAAQLEQVHKWQLKPIPFCDSGFWVTQGGEHASRTIEHRLGFFYIQEAASMLPVELFDLDGIEKPLILDMAASPGGKTTHLAARTGDKGLIIANDASRSRIAALQIVLGNWGAVNHAVTCLPGEMFGKIAANCFDAVLLDAPCSMQGLRTSESHIQRGISEKEINQLAQRQVRLLESALRTVKPGGQVVYSTCTLTHEENEGVLSQILDLFPGQVTVADVSTKLPISAQALDRVGKKQFPSTISHALRIWPHLLNTAGFFTAKLEKKAPFSEIPGAEIKIDGRKPKIRILKKDESAGILHAFQDQYDLDLVQLMDEQSLQLVEVNRSVFLLPIHLLEKHTWLPWLSAGIPLGKLLPDGWQPSHNFATRFGNRFMKGTIGIDDTNLDAWLRGEDIRGFKLDQSTSSKVVLVNDTSGRILGLGKLLKDRLRNLLPTRLF
jgi:16S rRNA (cytosine1407-C5)-methyltransferase